MSDIKRQASTMLADEIVRAIKKMTDDNNKQYVNNQIKNFRNDQAFVDAIRSGGFNNGVTDAIISAVIGNFDKTVSNTTLTKELYANYAQFLSLVANNAEFDNVHVGNVWADLATISAASIEYLDVGKLIIRRKDGVRVQVIVDENNNVITETLTDDISAPIINGIIQGSALGDGTVTGNKLVVETIDASHIKAETFASLNLEKNNSIIRLIDGKISLLVKGADSQSSLTLTEEMINAVAEAIRFDAQDKISLAVRDSNAFSELHATANKIYLLISDGDSASAFSLTPEAIQIISDSITITAEKINAIANKIDFSTNESIALAIRKKNANFYKDEPPIVFDSGDIWVKPNDGTWWIARGMTGVNMPEIISDEHFHLLVRFGEDAEDYQLIIDDDGNLCVNYGSGQIDEDGYLCSSTEWESLKPSELHTDFINIERDKINIGSGGNVHINAGGELNVNAGAAHFRTAEYTLSILDGNGSEDTIMDFDAEGKVLRVSKIESDNMRPYISGTTQVTSTDIGGIDGLKSMLKRAQYEHVVYTQNTPDMSDEVVVIDCCDSLRVEIVADTLTRVPPIEFQCVTGNFLFRNLEWITFGQIALRMDSGEYVFENCSAEAAIGIHVSRNARVVWLGMDENMETAGMCDSAVIATEGADVRLVGLIPAGLLTESMAGTIKAVDTRVGGNATGETGKTITIDAEFGYFGTENGWNADMLYQGYTEGKGLIYGCMKLELPSDVHVITAATLTLTRDSNAGRGSAANVRIYGSATKYGERPTLGNLYVKRDDAVSPGASASFDVTAGAQDLLNGNIKQFVLYTGESTTATGKVYSRQYARYTKATLKITY